MRIVPIILCGGAGTRLWPLSRESLPKHLLPMLGGPSTFQRTLQRFAGEADFLRPIVITAADARFLVADQIAALGLAADLVLEPSRQDSAAAVAVGAVEAAAREPDALALVLAADHLIPDAAAFRAAVREAAKAASQGLVMTLGVAPTAPATGYGYLAPGGPVAGTASFRLQAFKEKPDAATAARYIAEGYLWNSGNFLFPPALMLAELEAHAPAVLAAARAALGSAERDRDFIRLDAQRFAEAPKISIDFAVMEKTAQAGVTPYGGDWSDIGGFDALWQVSPKDADGNVVVGDAVALASRNSLVHGLDQGEGPFTALVGLDDVVVVTTKDAVLVASQAKAGAVKDLVASLRLQSRKEADEHNRMHRPWGWYQRIDIGPGFQAKRIHVRPGGRLSLQKHRHRAEHWVVIRGEAEVTRDGQVFPLRVNEAAHLPLGSVHRLENKGAEPLEIVEVQIGSYTGEDDIVRIEDVYGR